MTTTELHQHFKVEYDKANVISAYPSFLPEEIDIWLNKAYSMLISQKFTGNNFRKIAFEGDIKRTDDLQSLIKTKEITTSTPSTSANNAIAFNLSTVTDYLHYILSTIKLDGTTMYEVVLTSHELSQKVKETGINKPWVPRPIGTLSSDVLTIYYDRIANKEVTKAKLNLTYLSVPAKIDIITKPTVEIEISNNATFELINLAVLLALENIESERMDTKGQTLLLQE